LADIFISYKSERRNAAQHLSRILELNGYSVWFDYGLFSGIDFGRQIEREIRAAKVVVVLWCSLSRDSRWVLEEAHLAQRLETLRRYGCSESILR
jgi:TIR domain